jgi:UDP-N-acetylglucosamine--N-acetylmuramyl-(pentapeptide) pyrophosphoryl-undecaprenol N-acetylglucosamine transferase
MTMGERIVVAGGGTAGHVFPGLSLARALGDRGHDVSFIGTERGVEAKLVPAAGIRFHAIDARPFPREISVAALSAPLVAIRSVRRCRELVRGAGAIVGLGGYASVSSVLAARRERVPIVLHEQNAVPGLANRALSRLSHATGISFPDSHRLFPRRVRTVITGNPVREEIVRVSEEREALAKEALAELDLEDGRRTVVIFGGSQGALHVNRAAIGACRLLENRSDLQVVLITGSAHLDAVRREWRDRAGGILLRILGYLDRMELAYARADLVVSRSGATTVAELTACGRPSLLIPYPYATGRHQEANARSLQRAGGASVLLDDQLSAQSLAARVEALVDHEERLAAMAERARAFGRPDAAARLAELVVEVARG